MKTPPLDKQECKCHCHKQCPGSRLGPKNCMCLCFPQECEHCSPSKTQGKEEEIIQVKDQKQLQQNPLTVVKEWELDIDD